LRCSASCVRPLALELAACAGGAPMRAKVLFGGAGVGNVRTAGTASRFEEIGACAAGARAVVCMTVDAGLGEPSTII
jgi:hypothetical protein